MSRTDELDCLVIGGGPAGLTAAMYLRRFERRVGLVDAGTSRALGIPRTHNYPGFPEGIAGPALLERMRDQLARYGGGVTAGRVSVLRRPPGSPLVFEADIGDARLLRTRRVLLATGVADLDPRISGAQALRERGLLRHCPVCDGHEFRGARIGVLGRDEHAVREAQFLATFSDRVELLAVHVNTALPAAVRELARRCGVRVAPGVARALSVDGAGIEVRLGDDGARRVDVVYAALGVRPSSELARRLGVRLTPSGTIRIDPHGQTNVAGVYAAGDVVDALDQIAVATGQAAIAATAIHNSLR